MAEVEGRERLRKTFGALCLESTALLLEVSPRVLWPGTSDSLGELDSVGRDVPMELRVKAALSKIRKSPSKRILVTAEIKCLALENAMPKNGISICSSTLFKARNKGILLSFLFVTVVLSMHYAHWIHTTDTLPRHH